MKREHRGRGSVQMEGRKEEEKVNVKSFTYEIYNLVQVI